MSGGANLDSERLPCKHLHGNLGEKFLNFRSSEIIP